MLAKLCIHSFKVLSAFISIVVIIFPALFLFFLLFLSALFCKESFKLCRKKLVAEMYIIKSVHRHHMLKFKHLCRVKSCFAYI